MAVTPVPVPNLAQYNFAIGDTVEAIDKDNGRNAAIELLVQNLNVSIGQFNSDVQFVHTARQELDAENIVHAPGSGLPNAAGTAYQYPDTRYAHRGNNLSDLSNAATARSNLGLGSAATQADTRYAHRANNLSDLSNAATARSNLGLGSAATVDMGTAGTQLRTNTQNDSRFLIGASNLSDLSNAATARSNLGLGAAALLGTTSSRTSTSTDHLLLANAMNNHRTSGDHDDRYANSSVSLSAGPGLSGGGDLSANRTISMGTPSSITATSTNSTTTTSHTHAITEGTIRSLISDGSVGDVGTYAMLRNNSSSLNTQGSTLSGSNLQYSPARGWGAVSGSPAGTWRCMGRAGGSNYDISEERVTIWLRIS